VNRFEKATKFINLNGEGLEIGPSYNPIVRKTSGANIKILDHTDRDGLIKKYWWMPEDIRNSIEKVDFIWEGGTLLDTIGNARFDYIIASHFIEHSIDIIGFLKDCEHLLKQGGVLSLIIPDKRYCFDRFKPLTTVGAALDVHLNQTKYHTPGAVLDHKIYSVFGQEDELAWDKFSDIKMKIEYQDLVSQKNIIKKALQQEEYIDIHHWIFTPSSFSLFIQDLSDLGYTTLLEIGSFKTTGFDFYISLSKTDLVKGRLDRMEMLKKIENELCSINSLKTNVLIKLKKQQIIINSIKNKIKRISSK